MDNLVINALFTLGVFVLICGVIIAIDIHNSKKENHAAE